MASDLVSINQAAETLDVSHMTVRRMIQRGELPAFRLGKSRVIRIKSADLNKLLRPVTPLAEVVADA